MILNADQVVNFLITNNKGAKAQVGYDITLKSLKRVNGGVVMSNKTIVSDYNDITPLSNAMGNYIFKIEPGTYSITFEQGIKLDNKHTAFIRHRSSLLRCGSIITSGVYDPGFEVDEMGAILLATQPIILEKGARCAQILIFQSNSAEMYTGQFQGKLDLK